MLKTVLHRLLRPGTRDASAAHVVQARAHLNEGRHVRAIEICDAVLAAGAHAEAAFIRGTARLELGDAAGAISDLANASGLSPEEPRYLYNLAVANWNLGRSAETVRLCERIVDRHDFGLAREFLGNIELHGDAYLGVLARLHEYLRPGAYLEIGVFRGLSLMLTGDGTTAIGVDPDPRVEGDLGARRRVFAERSDDFFAGHDVIAELGGRIDMAFIDGMHRFEFALRDFANVERSARRDSVVLIHDGWPLDRRTSEREQSTLFWSGDIWRLIVLLKRHRPDLSVHTIATPPTGLAMVLNLDPSSSYLIENHDRLVAEMLAEDYSLIEGDKKAKLGFFPNDWDAIRELVDSRDKA